jgi:hypothetical protein
MDYVPYLSATQIAMFLRCARQWAYRYIERLIVPPSGAMKQSGVFHSTAERNYLQKIDSRSDLKVDELTDFFGDTFEHEFKREEVKLNEGETKGALKAQGLDIVKVFHRNIAPYVQPVQVEQRFELSLTEEKGGQQPFKLVGVIDVVDERGHIRDNKAISPQRVPNQFELARDLQLSTYSLARRLMTKEVEPELDIDAVVKYARPEARMLRTARSREGLRMHLNTIGNIAKAIRADAFPRNPTGWWCSEKWCGYWGRCMGKGLVTIDLSENLEPLLEESVSRAEKERQEKDRQKGSQAAAQAGQEGGEKDPQGIPGTGDDEFDL